jgi:acetolactate synthase-1/3 small subunit
MTHPQQQLFTVTIYSENCVGVINQVSAIFTRRCLNIEDCTASMSSVPNIHKLTLTTWADRPTMEKVVKQIEKRIEILKAFLYTDDEIIYQEVALYKLSTQKLLEEGHIEDVIREHHIRILEINSENTTVAMTGKPEEIMETLESLRKYEVRQFVHSGRVSVTKSPIEYMDLHLERQERRREQINNE